MRAPKCGKKEYRERRIDLVSAIMCEYRYRSIDLESLVPNVENNVSLFL